MLRALQFSVLLVAQAEAPSSCRTDHQPGGGFARRVVVVGIDGIAPSLAASPTLRRLLSQGAGTVNARANLPSLTAPNWAAVITGAGASETSIATNTWSRSTARAPPVELGGGDSRQSANATAAGIYPRASEAWFPNVLEVAEGAGCNVSLFHNWEPLNRPLSPGFVRRSVRTVLCGVAAGSVQANFSSPLDCWGATDVLAADGAVGAIGAFDSTPQSGRQLIFVHQANVDEIGHVFGWGSGEQMTAMATADTNLAKIVAAIEAVDPAWSQSLLLVTAFHGGYERGHNERTLPQDALVPDLLRVPWVIHGAGVAVRLPFYTAMRNVHRLLLFASHPSPHLETA
eukprot:SAG25_NODE_804_length_5258_cov_4.192285_3_plen_343_part_00